MSTHDEALEVWLSREHGISTNDAHALLELVKACRPSEGGRVPITEPFDAERLASILWLVHLGLVLTEDHMGVLYVFPGDKGREAVKAAKRIVRRARRAA